MKTSFKIFAVLLIIVVVGYVFSFLSNRGVTNEVTKQEISFISQERRIQGFLYRPDRQPAPAILYLHGGTIGFQDDAYVEEMRKHGVVILALNYPGEGRSEGEKENPVQENKAAIDAIVYLKTLPFVNPNKIGILGFSHGAGIALMTIEKTDVQVAVDVYGAVDAREVCAYWAENHIGEMTKQTCLNFTDEYYAARSPIVSVENIKTPLLIIHGGEDDIVPVEQSEKLVGELRKLNKVYLYKKYPDAPHGFINTGSADAKNANIEIVNWFEKYF